MISRTVCATIALAFAYAHAQSTASQYGQCGGIGWTGATLCPSGWSCNVVNDYYSQCLPGGATGTVTSSATSSSGGSTSTSTAPVATSTLLPGNSFIRSVEEPYFHYYLQSITPGNATAAIMGSYTSAAQFQVTDGQLIQESTPPLYAIVEDRANSSVMTLAVSWSTTPATSGTFDFSGDTIEWSIPTIDRPQLNAWYVCPDSEGNNLLFVNLGYYDYETPTGCADETIHFYTGATAVP
ncbi:carbohydrate-binding module family 1 protein [Lentinula raphanica]|uniref:Carbohydrate-binding module family 1 protein n=1 Tax=Lentinula raphanica TaxID=153919 RepID=A0AA38PDL8_9AGAR|nr:carbohydrate-binding module family 1 protein [Lentinula raphanica]KAJ3757979.1 carbohydrate-binding module family 1 protein [Lentinula raphanica]KAJ3829505.1 carbohydrate-binding module family 1 protein [Lentinula raphanica]KAJ3840703.1 carbohydrate-binding module family 1 protein [Lentinula raphanica]KAJ3967349.1 carbohydrate-binding module family 1 protein [Lentinula raphanica]